MKSNDSVMDEETYHYDFTTASELEIFIARVEEILQEWGLHNKMLEECLKAGDFKLKEWCSTSENLNFADEEFKLTRYYLKCDKVNDLDDGEGKSVEDVPSQAVEDMMSIDNDFFCNGNSTENTHPISRWYGLRDFVILVPRYISSVTSESRIKILLSVVSIAGANIKCKVPLFVQTLHPWQSYFLGIHQLGTFHTDFNMIHLKHTPSPCKYLTGLLSMFKSKIGLRMLTSPVTVSVQFTYILKDWTSTSWLQESPDFEYLGGEVLFESEVGSLPFGSSFDSIKELHLRTIWPSLLENSIMDGENYSDLDPLQAPIWRVSIVAIDNPSCLLTDYFSEFLNLSEVKHSLKEILGSIIGGGSNSNLDKVDLEISSSLNALTESKISSFSKAVIGGDRNVKKENMKTNNQSEKPISSENLMVLLYYLFPDADEDTKVPYIENLGGKPSEDSAEGTKSKCLNKTLTGMKSAPYDGLLWRLATAMSHVIHAMGGLRAAAYFWYEFTQELRYRWENGILIQGLEFQVPDSKTCLLNQKLQLLNCCISRRIQRDRQASERTQGDSESEEEDEFFDCCDGDNEENEGKGRKVKTTTAGKPMGRLAKHGDMKLLETGEPLYIPVTQDSVPKTEDQLEEDTQVLVKLGSDALGSELRAKLLSAYLLSDMEAFKAANPGCILADFIRWCSPRDWIENEDGELDDFGQKKGHLSHRMEIPGNTWQEVWEVARPSPAKWQKRLFNDTREAEKILDYLERKTPSEFVKLLLPVFSVCVLQKLLDEMTDELPGLNDVVTKLIKKAEWFSRMSTIDEESYKDLVNDISGVETSLVHLKSLKRKFTYKKNEPDPEVMEFIKSLLTTGETEVPGGPKSKIATMIRNFFSEAAKADPIVWDTESQLTSEKWNVMSPFLSPNEKEMILRVSTAQGPQRLHAILKKNECRICGAFTSNVFFPNN